jgi:hypothetical protein
MLSRNLTKLGYLGRTNTQNTNIPFYDEGTPSLDLNFAGNKNLVDNVSSNNLVTFTRASSGTYVGDDGFIKTATTDEPRFDHNPVTRESLGLLVEESRTNSLRNNTMVGAVAGTPGTAPTYWTLAGSVSGITREIIGIGTDNGIAYIDVKYSGTASNNLTSFSQFDGNTIVAASSGQAWTSSVYIKVQAGSLIGINNFTIFCDELNNMGNVLVRSTSTLAPTSASLLTQRSFVTRTFDNANTAYTRTGLRFEVSSGVAIDITLRIGLPQLEQGAFATSVIPTSGSAVTRSADVASISGSNFSSWYRQDEGTVFVRGSGTVISGINSAYYDISDGTNNEQIYIRNAGVAPQFVVNDGGVEQVSLSGASLTANVPASLASAYKINDFETTQNGASTLTSTLGTLPTVDRLALGYRAAAVQYFNGTLTRFTYFPTRLSNTTLQNITR